VVQFIGYDTVPLGALTPFPGNPRRGALAHIKTSLARFGQYRTIVVWPQSASRAEGLVIVAGNHTSLAMRELSELDPVEYERLYGQPGWQPYGAWTGDARIECSAFDSWDEARRVNAADNRLAEMGGYDDDALRVLLETFGDDWAGVGWIPDDLRLLRADFDPSGEPPPPLDQLEPRLCQRCGYDVANDPEGLAE